VNAVLPIGNTPSIEMNLKTSPQGIHAPTSILKRDPNQFSTLEREIALKNLN